jgi:integrase
MPTNIGAEGKCPECGSRFKFSGSSFSCPNHKSVKAERYFIQFKYKGTIIRRGTDLNGKTLRSYADAFSLRNRAMEDIEGHKFNPTKWTAKGRIKYRFDTLIEKWLASKQALSDRGRLSNRYPAKLKGYINKYYLGYYAHMDVREISAVNIKEWQMQLPPSLSDKSIKDISDALRNFFNTLSQDDLIDKAPHFPTVEVAEHQPEVLSPELQMLILAEIPQEHKPIFSYLMFQGCRPSEARALKWDCIEGDVVTYKRTFSGAKLVEHTKTKKIRYNLLFPETLSALPSRTFPLDFVFTHQYGKHRQAYGFSLLNSIYRKAIVTVNANNGLSLSSELYEHTKHSFGTQLANKDVPMQLLQGWFGHTSAKTTEKYAKYKVVNGMRRVASVVGMCKVCVDEKS